MPTLRILAAVAMLVVAACTKEDDALFGVWEGTITEEQRLAINLDRALPDNRFVIELFHKGATLNGKKIAADYNKNAEVHFINEVGTNATMSARLTGPDTMDLAIPKYFHQGILRFEMRRVKQN
jgi:hypothetical protein